MSAAIKTAVVGSTGYAGFELTRLLTRALEYMPESEKKTFQPRRNRPRRTGKAL